MVRRVAGFTVRRPRLVLVVALLLSVVGMVAGVGVFGRMNTATGTVPGSESMRASHLLDQASAGRESLRALVAGRSLDDRAAAEAVRAAVRDVRAMAGVQAVSDPVRAVTGRAFLLDVTLGPSADPDRQVGVAEAVAARLTRIDPDRTTVTGNLLTDGEFGGQALADVRSAETLTTPVVLVLLVVIFGGLVAGLMPLLVAAAGVSGAFGMLYAFSTVTDVSVYAIQVVTMLAVGLGVDYALLIVNRFREERAAVPGGRPSEAVRRTLASAGRTVAFSGLTVAVSLAGLGVFQDPFLRSMGIAGACVVTADMLAALTLLPALLVVAGHRITPAGSRAAGSRAAGSGRFARLATAVQRRPVATLLAVTGVLVVLLTPATGLQLGGIGPRALPERTQTRMQYEALAEHFPEAVGPASVEVVARAGAVDPGLAVLRDRVAAVPGVQKVAVVPVSPSVTMLRADVGATASGDQARRVVLALRELRAPFGTMVTGAAAQLVDHRAMLRSRAPWAALVVLLATFALLFWFTGSVLLPVKAILTSALSIGAALGPVVWIFQDGHLVEWFGAVGVGQTDSMVPVLVMAIAFGLSVDYEVFLLSRIRERWLSGSGTAAAVAEGLQDTGRIVTSAALLMAVVFAGFVLGGFVPIKEIGLGLTLAVALDATLVRMLLVPATMTLAGRYNWWAPRPLAVLHRRLDARAG